MKWIVFGFWLIVILAASLRAEDTRRMRRDEIQRSSF